MSRPLLSPAAGALLRSLLARVNDERSRILLTSWATVDWQSLTFSGERHQASFTVGGEDAGSLVARWLDGLDDAELPVGSGRFVGEIKAAVCGTTPDGQVLVELEALTLDD